MALLACACAGGAGGGSPAQDAVAASDARGPDADAPPAPGYEAALRA